MTDEQYLYSYYFKVFTPSKLVTSNGHIVTVEETIAEEFNNYFINIG